MIPLRAAMPRTVTKPTSDPSERTPPVISAARTPPTSANGKRAKTTAAWYSGANFSAPQIHITFRRDRVTDRRPVKDDLDLLRFRAGVRVAFRLIPREQRFFDDFVALSEEIQRGAVLLEEMLAPERPLWDKADENNKAK